MSITEWELRQRQALNLRSKVIMTKMRLQEFVREYGEDGVYLSLSGGKDSTILHYIATEICGYKNIKSVYLDTWMEYPEVRQFVKTNFDNVEIIKPEKSMKAIINEVGYCFPSKDVSEMIEGVRNDKEWAIKKLNGLDKDGNYSEFRQQYKKWKILVDAPFKISRKCCIELKEKPVSKFEKRTGRHPIVALMADESAARKDAYMKTGCNTFDKTKVFNSDTGEFEIIGSDRPISKPMGFWLENDVLQFIYENKIPIAAPYGQVVEVGQIEGQYNLFDTGCIGNCDGCKFRTTAEKRTGCCYCMIGSHLPGGFDKFKRLRQTQPKLYEYAMDELGIREVLSWIDRNIVQKAS